MKKLIDFIKSKDKTAISEKKAYLKTEKEIIASSNQENANHPKDLFWDDYSDVGYC